MRGVCLQCRMVDSVQKQNNPGAYVDRAYSIRSLAKTFAKSSQDVDRCATGKQHVAHSSTRKQIRDVWQGSLNLVPAISRITPSSCPKTIEQHDRVEVVVEAPREALHQHGLADP